MRVVWRIVGRRRALAGVAVEVLEAVVNVLVVFWLCQLAFPSLGLVPPTILGALGITALVAVLRHPISIRETEP